MFPAIDVQPEEVRFLNLTKVILDGGWVIQKNELAEVYSISGLASSFEQFIEESNKIKTGESLMIP